MAWLRCMNFFLSPDTEISTQPSGQRTLDGRQKWQPAANHTMDISKETMQKCKKYLPHTLANWIQQCAQSYTRRKKGTVPAGTGINPQMLEPILKDTEICKSPYD